MLHSSQGSQLHYHCTASSRVCLIDVGSNHPIQHTGPGTSPEESCQIYFQRLHNKDTWLCDQDAGRSGMGYITEKATSQQTLRMWDLIVSVPDHCLSFYFSQWCIKLITILWMWKRRSTYVVMTVEPVEATSSTNREPPQELLFRQDNRRHPQPQQRNLWNARESASQTRSRLTPAKTIICK